MIFSKRAETDWELIKQSPYWDKVVELLRLMEENPFADPPPVKQLVGDMKGAFSRRINHQHRLVYLVDRENRRVKIVMMWLHYE